MDVPVKDRIGYAVTPELVTPDDCPDAFKGKTFYIFVDPNTSLGRGGGFRLSWVDSTPAAKSLARGY